MSEIFRNISEKDKCKLLKTLEANTHTFRKNESFFQLFKNDKMIGIVLSGNIQIIKNDYEGNEILMEDLEEGDIFGNTISSIQNVEHNIVVKEESTIILIDYNHILNCNIEKDYYLTFMKNLLEIVMHKLQEKNERLEILTKKTIRNKILEYLKIMRTKHGSRFVYLPFNFKDLADYLVIDRSAMTRELKYLKEEGFIAIKGKRIEILYDI